MPSEQPPTRVGTCTFCGGDGVVTRSFGINDSGRPEIVPCPSCQPAPPSEQSREGEERVYTIWLCGECKAGPQEPTKGGWVCGECGASDRTNYLDQAKVVRREPAQPQPKEGTRAKERLAELLRGRSTAEAARDPEVQAFLRDSGPVAPVQGVAPEDEGGSSSSASRGPDRPAQPQPRGEGDDLAARLDERAELWERKGGLGANIAAGAYRQAAEMARASTHPEQPARETNLRMNRWREHLGDDPLDGFGGRGPAEYHYMATHEPEGPGLTRFGNRGFRPAPPRGEGDDLAARLKQEAMQIRASRDGVFSDGMAEGLDRAASIARASTHPEQSARVTGEQALALAGWIEGNVWQDSTVDVADLLRVLGGFE